MPNAAGAAFREELRRAGVPCRGPLARLLMLLRRAEDTHLRLAEVTRIAEAAGLGADRSELARQVEALADRGLLGRVPTTAAEPVFDTVPEPHSHLVYAETEQTVDLHVSPETLLAILRQMLQERSDSVEVLIRVRPPSASAAVDRPASSSRRSSIGDRSC